MSLALNRNLHNRLFRNLSISKVASRTLRARQKSWHLNFALQGYCSSMAPANPMQKYTRPPAQFHPVQELSPRDPHCSAQNNDADKIEKWLREDGHRIWGLVIYRSTYQSDADWDEFMRRILADITESLEAMAGLDLLDNLALTVFDDPQKFDGATTAVIRDHFKQWAATAEQKEQAPEFDPERIRVLESQRYRYCIQVTQEMLESALADERENMAIVRIIRGDWEEYSPFDEDGFRIDDEGEAIEGCTLNDVGWINVPLECLIVTYCYLRGEWETEYRRPPEISCYP